MSPSLLLGLLGGFLIAGSRPGCHSLVLGAAHHFFCTLRFVLSKVLLDTLGLPSLSGEVGQLLPELLDQVLPAFIVRGDSGGFLLRVLLPALLLALVAAGLGSLSPFLSALI